TACKVQQGVDEKCATGIANGNTCVGMVLDCVSGVCAAGKCRQQNGTSCINNADCGRNICDANTHQCIASTDDKQGGKHNRITSNGATNKGYCVPQPPSP